MKKKLLFSLLILALVALPLLTACGAEEVTPPTPPTPPPTSINIAYPGNFMMGLVSVDPCDFANGGPPNPNVFETLVGQDASDALVSCLADNWSWSEDGLTLTVNLKQDVVFSSGDPFTAADVIFSLNRHAQKDMPVIDQLSPGQGYAGVEAVGDYTALFHFTKVNVQFVPQTLAMMGITSKTYYDRVGEDAYVALPVGTGPYKIVDWAEGQYLNLAYNENWRGEKPQILTAHLVAYGTPATGAAMLQAGEVDLLSQAPPASITTLTDAGFKRVDVPQAHNLVMQFNLLASGTPWSDVRVRQAIDYAIDKQSIADAMVAGPILSVGWSLPTAPWYNASLKPNYDYDLTTAQQLMAAAGYADGFTLPVTYLANETVTPLADYLASALQAINITVELTALAGMPDFMGALISTHNAYENGETVPATVGAFVYDAGWPGNPEVSIDLTNGFYWGKANTLFYNEEITGLVDQVLSTVDDDARYALADQAWTAINDLLPQVPIGLEVQVNMMLSNITYTKSVGGMNQGPMQLVDLTIE